MSRPFRFKRFTVSQERAAMKVGTDGVLLGAWCTVEPGVERALDIGAGTGLIALMLAQRSAANARPPHIDALEPEPGAFADATANAAASPWAGRITILNRTVQDHAADPAAAPYDLIVSNPPYFTASLLPPSSARAAARHDAGLTRGELIRSAAALSRPGTLFAVVVPADQAAAYVIGCDMAGFTPVRLTEVHTTADSPPKRTLVEFRYQPGLRAESPVRDKLVIQDSPEHYTEQYRRLTGEFYLKF